MRATPLNVIQIILMILVVACPSIGGDWPTVSTAMQVTAAIAASGLAIVNLYAPPLVPASILTPVGFQAVHVMQLFIGAIVSALATAGVARPTWDPAVHIVSDVGGILMGVLGLFSPKALGTPSMFQRRDRVTDPEKTHD